VGMACVVRQLSPDVLLDSLCTLFVKSLLRRFDDSAEKCRELAATCLLRCTPSPARPPDPQVNRGSHGTSFGRWGLLGAQHGGDAEGGGPAAVAVRHARAAGAHRAQAGHAEVRRASCRSGGCGLPLPGLRLCAWLPCDVLIKLTRRFRDPMNHLTNPASPLKG
jgi:hypothetical protein